MNPVTILNILLLLFTLAFVQLVLAQSNINNEPNSIPVIEKSLQADTSVSSPETKSFPLDYAKTDKQPNTSAPTPVEDKTTPSTPSSNWGKAKQDAGNAWKETKTMSSSAWGATKKGSDQAWDATKKGSNEVWGSTKKTSSEVWDITKDGSKKAWDKTKKASSSAWKATKSAIHDGADYISEKTKD